MAPVLRAKRSAISAVLPLREVAAKRPRALTATQRICKSAHQFGFVGGEDYDSRETRLTQLLERLPGDGSVVVILAEVASYSVVQAVVDRCRENRAGDFPASSLPCEDMDKWQRRSVATPCRNDAVAQKCAPKEFEVAVTAPRVVVSFGRAPDLPLGLESCEYLINFDLPASGREYLRRLNVFAEGDCEQGVGVGVVYTLVEEKQLESKPVCDIVALLTRAKGAAAKDVVLGGLSKAAELDSALQQLANEFDGGEEEDTEEDATSAGNSCGDDCDCVHCTGCSVASVSYHGASRGEPAPRVEVVRLPQHCLEDLSKTASLVAPRLSDHSCTIVCLHNLNTHNPWDGAENLFALPPGMGSIRVVMVLAEGCSWHDYPDVGAFAGGVSWVDIMDPVTMDATDKLIEKLVDHEILLLGGRSERLVLMGASQGGGQSMLRFLRSKRKLGGWVGSVCHAPTAPHLPRDVDPLVGEHRSRANCSTPVRLLAAEQDSVFGRSLVERDVRRLRTIGGFTDVCMEVLKGHGHEGALDEADDGPMEDLLFLQRCLPAMLLGCGGKECC